MNEATLRARWRGGCPKCGFAKVRYDIFTESITNGKRHITCTCPSCGQKESTE